MQECFNLEIWELGYSRPELLGGGSEHSEDPEELIYLRVSLEQRPPVDHLGEDGADAPDVQRAGVLGAAKKNLKYFNLFLTKIWLKNIWSQNYLDHEKYPTFWQIAKCPGSS